VTLPNDFTGCSSTAPAPTVAEVLNTVPSTQVAAYVTNAVTGVDSVTVTDTTDNTVTLSVQSSTDPNTLIPEFQKAFADLLGNGVSPSDIDVIITPSAKRSVYSSTVTATINDPGTGSPAWRLDVLVALLSVVLCALAF